MANNVSVSLTNISMYQSIVANHYQQYQELADEHDKLSLEKDDTSLGEMEQTLYRLQCAMDCEAAIICTFSYMTLEAFCNVYLLQHLSRSKVEKKSFLEKVNLSIVRLLAENGKVISHKDASLFYGADIKTLVNIRNKMVHRYPVRVDISLKSDDSFQKGSSAAARQIEDSYLRRISRANVNNAATAYAAFLAKMKEAGVDFSKLSFIYE